MNTILRKYLPTDLVKYAIGKYNGVTQEEVQKNRVWLSMQLEILCDFEVQEYNSHPSFKPFKYDIIDQANEMFCQKLIRRVKTRPFVHDNRFSNASILERKQCDLEVLETHHKWHRRSCYEYATQKKKLYKEIDYYQSL